MSFTEQLREWFTPPQPKPSTDVEYRRYLDLFSFNGNQYPLYGQTTWGSQNADPISLEFMGFVDGALKADGAVSALELKRISVFAEARFLFQRFRDGRPGDLFPMAELALLERPFRGGTTGDLLTRMLLDADLAGNFYGTVLDGEIVRLRPDWVEIVLTPRLDGNGRQIGSKRLGYLYYEGGKSVNDDPAMFTADQVAHFAPYPDPAASYRGMSWLTPVVREIQADVMATTHKLKFFENGATPNLHVSWAQPLNKDQFDKFVDIMEENHAGAENAYKTLYTSHGADVTVLGRDMQQMDFKATQGAGETRLAAAAGVPAVIVGFSEGMQGSSLNAGNYQAAKRNFADSTLRPLWRNAAGSLETLIPPPSDARLWYDDRDISFLREDLQDRANVQQTHAITIRNLVDAGYEPVSVVDAVNAEDMRLLKHSGLFSVQLQPAGSEEPSADDMTPEDGMTEDE